MGPSIEHGTFVPPDTKETLNAEAHEDPSKALSELKELRKDPRVANFAKKLKTLGLSFGLAMLMAGCGGISRQELEKIPGTKVEELSKNMENFREAPTIKTEGVPKFVGKTIAETLEWTPKPVRIQKRYDYFKLRDINEPSSAELDMLAEGEERKMDSLGAVIVSSFTEPTGSNLSETHRYTFLGRVVKAKDQNGKEKLFFKVDKEFDTTLEEVK